MKRAEPPNSGLLTPADLLSRIRYFLGDRIQVNSALIVICFLSVLALESQSAASYSTYLLALAMLWSLRDWDDLFHLRASWLLGGLLAYLPLTAFWSEPFEWRDVVSVFTRSLLVLCFVAAVAECQLRGQLRRWLGRAMALVGMGAVIAAMVVHYSDPPTHGRLNGLGQLDTQVVAALVYGACLVFVLDVVLTDQSRVWRVVAGASGLIIAYAVFLSDSRNAWVSVALGTAALVMAHRIRSPQNFVAVVALFAVVCAALIGALIANPETRDLVLPRGDSFRLIIWSEIWGRIQANGLLFGLGINSPDNVVAFGREFLHPHNMYLSVFYQGGILGLLGLLLLIAVTLQSLMRHYARLDAKLALAILAIALPAYLLDGHELIDKVGATWFLFWFPVGIALGLRWSSPVLPLGLGE